MADYSGYTLTSARSAITPGDPQSLRAGAAAFAGVQRGLDATVTDLSAVANTVFAGDRPGWAGPAATACRAVIDGLLRFMRDVSPLLDPFDPLLRQAATDLQTAQKDLAAITVDATLPVDPVADAQARTILVTLADSYDTIAARLGSIPTTPNELRELSEPGAGAPHAPIVDGPMAYQAGHVPTKLAFHQPPVSLPSPTTLGPVITPLPTGAPVTLASAGPLGGPLTAGVGPFAGGNPSALSTSGSSGPGGAGGPAGNPATRLTTTRRIAGIGAEPGGGQLGMPGPGGQPLGTSLLGRGGQAGRGEPGAQAREGTRSTELVGDEDWSDHAGLHGAIGRPQQTGS